MFYDRLTEAHGPQHWWPHQDAAHPRFEIFIGAVLTQHTAWTNVERAIATLLEAGPLTAEALLANDDLAGCIRQAGPHRVKAERLRALCRWFVEAGGFEALDTWSTADLCTALRDVRGIGPETADVIALYAFDRPRFVADAYAFRILERYGWWTGRTRRYETLRLRVEDQAPAGWRAADYDETHALIVEHAKRVCHKRRPACDDCVLLTGCAQHGL
ncbi:endonuclease [Salinisphaera sp. Q1T1-3]|nr:endonuclease [Salinisphaera sp. Q1T1-3]